mmetsp:Transcript_15112/g.48201  ORF Transcript_15112/g.48201 Transcript_15112/m.48201 type:complete len:224 (+) Transcript_15112:86-757(+)
MGRPKRSRSTTASTWRTRTRSSASTWMHQRQHGRFDSCFPRAQTSMDASRCTMFTSQEMSRRETAGTDAPPLPLGCQQVQHRSSHGCWCWWLSKPVRYTLLCRCGGSLKCRDRLWSGFGDGSRSLCREYGTDRIQQCCLVTFRAPTWQQSLQTVSDDHMMRPVPAQCCSAHLDSLRGAQQGVCRATSCAAVLGAGLRSPRLCSTGEKGSGGANRRGAAPHGCE